MPSLTSLPRHCWTPLALFAAFLWISAFLAAPVWAEGHYRLTVSYEGSATGSATSANGYGASSQVNGINVPYDLSALAPTSVDGTAITTTVTASAGGEGQTLHAIGSSSGVKVIVSIQYIPDPNAILPDIPLQSVQLTCRRSVSVSAATTVQLYGQIGNTGKGDAFADAIINFIGGSQASLERATRSLSVNIDSTPDGGSYNKSDSDTKTGADTNGDLETRAVVLDQNGFGQTRLDCSWSLRANADKIKGYSSANTSATLTFEIRLLGMDAGRHNGSIFDGLFSWTGNDPTFTRWAPLSFSPSVNSQPFRFGKDAMTALGPLPAPWGNVNCAYSPTVRRDKNVDANQAGLWYWPPDIGASSRANTRDGMGVNFVITDANGDRLVFRADNLTPKPDVFSTLTRTGGGFTLSNAGPPGAMRERGDYTYTFENVPSDDSTAPAYWNPGRLLTMRDSLINLQSCAYAAPNVDNLYMTVSDFGSQRGLLFYTSGIGGYVSDVIGPQKINVTPIVPVTRTHLTMDANGHMTQADVYAGSQVTTSAHKSQFTYQNDAILTRNDDGILATNVYLPGPAGDVYGAAIPRLSTTTVGDATDNTSSDDGNSVQGVYQYTWGASLGYGHYGIESRTNTATDARGNATTTIYGYGVASDASQTGAVRSVWVKKQPLTGADYTGTPGNQWATFYGPDRAAPTRIDVQDPYYHTWTTFLDAIGNPYRTTDPLNNSYEMIWGGSKGTSLLSVTDPTNLTWTFGYTATGGRVNQITDPNNQVQFQATYNGFGQPLTITMPAGSTGTTTYTYNPNTGDLNKIVNPAGATWLAGQFSLTSRAVITGTTYDALGDLMAFTVFPDTGVAVSTQYPATTKFTYNAVQMPVQIQGPNGVSQYNDFINNALSAFRVTDPAGSLIGQITLATDSRGRVYAASDLAGSLSQRRFDKNGNVTKFLDGKLNTIRASYGKNNEPVALFWPDNRSASLSYNPAGLVQQIQDERGIARKFEYDNANRLKRVYQPAYTGQDINLAYDNANRPLSVTDASGSVGLQYEPTRKRLQRVTTTVSGYSYNVDYVYRADGQLQSMTSPAGTWTYSYDAAARLSGVTNSQNEATTWGYDGIGRATGQTTTTGSTTIATAYTYGSTGQTGDVSTLPLYLRGVRETIGGATFRTYTLTRTYLGQLTRMDGAGGAVTDTQQFQYDLRGRMNQASIADNIGGTFTGGGTYSYDLANNAMGGTGGWTYNNNNQVTIAGALANGLAGATGLSYDYSGNLTGANGMTLVWDSWGRLSQVNNAPGGNISFTYDAMGRRAAKFIGGTLTARYLYSGTVLIGETNAAGTLTRSYTWGMQGLISDNGVGGSRFYLYDGSTNLRTLVSASGAIIWQGAYHPFGALAGGVTAPPTPFGWSGGAGGYADSETGLIKLGARYYAPALGRFISRDPSSIAGGPNLYAYCGGDPINFVDANGLWPDINDIANGEHWLADNMRPRSVWDELKFFRDPGMAMVEQTFFGLVDAYADCGTQQGLADGGKGNLVKLWMARANMATQTASAAMAIYGLSGGVAGTVGAATAEADALESATQEAADALRELPNSSRPTAATGFQSPNGKIYKGSSGFEGPVPEWLQEALDTVPEAARTPQHGRCAEIDSLRQASEGSVNGGRIRTVEVRGANSTTGKHGMVKPPCSSCRPVLKLLGVFFDE